MSIAFNAAASAASASIVRDTAGSEAQQLITPISAGDWCIRLHEHTCLLGAGDAPTGPGRREIGCPGSGFPSLPRRCARWPPPAAATGLRLHAASHLRARHGRRRRLTVTHRVVCPDDGAVGEPGRGLVFRPLPGTQRLAQVRLGLRSAFVPALRTGCRSGCIPANRNGAWVCPGSGRSTPTSLASVTWR